METREQTRFAVGDKVRLRDVGDFADECFRLAGGPSDPNAHLAMDLNRWPSPGPLLRVVSARPDLGGTQFCEVVGDGVVVGDGAPFGVRGGDLVTAEAA